MSADRDGGRSIVFSSDPARSRFARIVCLILACFGWANLAILGSVGLSKNPPTAGFDLQLLVDAARRVAAGHPPYDPAAVAHGLQARDLFYSYPPIVAQFLAPLAALPNWLILSGWCVGAAAGLVLVAELLARSQIGRPDSAPGEVALDVALVTLAAAPFFFPFLVALLFGNVDAWFPLLFGALALALVSDRTISSRATSIGGGAALALASIVKLHPGTLVIWLAIRWHGFRNERRGLATVIGAVIATGGGLLVVSLLLGGVGPWRDYVDYLRASGSASLTSWVNLGPASQLAMLTGNHDLARPLAVVFAVAAVVATVLAARLVRDPLESVGWAIVASLVVLPVTWYHYPVALIPVALVAWFRSRGMARGRRVTAALLGAYVVADIAILAPVALWLSVALLFVAVRWSCPVGADPAPATGRELATKPTEAPDSASAAVAAAGR
jgi:hypothetical protein